jgi:single-strand DNA-binding protein
MTMNDFSGVFMLGFCLKNAEVDATRSGIPVANFTISIGGVRNDAQGRRKDESSWHHIRAFGRAAEIARDHVKRGARVHIEGSLSTDRWLDNRTGEKRSRTVVLASRITVVAPAEIAPLREGNLPG